MGSEDGAGAQVAMTAMVTAAFLSPRVRGLLRQGAVHGLAGVLVAGDALVAFARGVSDGVQGASAARSQDLPAEGPRMESNLYAPGVASESPVPETVSKPKAGSSVRGTGARRRPPRKSAGTTATRRAKPSAPDPPTRSRNG
ncbi:MAG: hypothetical protein WKF55_02610 [Gemmatimonadaceae bacterium]